MGPTPSSGSVFSYETTDFKLRKVFQKEYS